MEEVTMERLLNDFAGVITQVEDIVIRKDITQARKVLEQIANLVSNDEKVFLDDRVNYDHVLHELLSKISGVIEIEDIKKIDIPDEMRIRLQELIERRRIVEERITQIDIEIRNRRNSQRGTGRNGQDEDLEAQIADLERQLRQSAQRREEYRRAGNTEGESRENSEYARLTEEIARLRNRQQERNNLQDNLEDQIEQLTNQLEELRRRQEERNQSNSNEQITDLERQLRQSAQRRAEYRSVGNTEGEAREASEYARITEEIANLRNRQQGRNGQDENLEAQIADLERQLRQSAQRRAEYRSVGNTEGEAREASEYARITEEIANLRNRQQERNGQDENIEAQIADLERQLRQSAQRRTEYRSVGNTEGEAREASEYARITEEIANLRNRQQERNGQDENLENQIAEIERKLAELRRQLQERNSQDEDLEAQIADLERQLRQSAQRRAEYRNVGNTEGEAREASEYARLAEEIAKLKNKQKDRNNTSNEVAPDERISILLKEKTTLEEELKKLNIEITNISGIKTKNVITDRLDLGEEARKIGDHIFKTADIRKELRDRNISREEFLEIYQAGKDRVNDELKEILKQIKKYEYDIELIALDENKNNLFEQLGDDKLKESKKIEVIEHLRRNSEQVLRLRNELKNRGFLNPITTQERAEEFAQFLAQFNIECEREMTRLRLAAQEQAENLEIFETEIGKINDEIKSINISKGDIDALNKESSDEKELRARQIKATVFGDEELEAEWDKRVQRFYSHKKDGLPVKYISKATGKEREVEFSTMEDYEQFAEDAKFLNLEDYNKYLRITSMCDSAEERYGEGAGLDLFKSVVDFNEPDFDEYHDLLATDPDKADQWLRNYIGQKKEYVKTFHGFTNEHAVKADTWRSAGSTLKYMKPVKGDLPMTTRMGNAVENVFRFFLIRKPEFSQVNQNGEKVSTTGKGILTLATDAAVIGGVTATALLAPAALPAIGIGYAARGVVTLANRVRGRIEYRKHKDVIDANLPTLGHSTSTDKEIIRKTYYRDKIKDEKGKLNILDVISTWRKAAITDRITPWGRKRARETEEQIVADRIALSNAVIDARTEAVKANAENNIKIADQNQIIRQENTRKEAMTDRTYNEIVKDPDSINIDETLGRVARNAAIRANRPDKYNDFSENVNPNSTVETEHKYLKKDPEMKQTQNLGNVSNKGATIANTAITEEQKYTARKVRQDRVNRVWTMVLSTLGKVGLDYALTGYKKDITVKEPKRITTQERQHEQKRWVEGGSHEEPIYDVKTTKEFTTDDISKGADSDIGLNDVYGFGGQISKGGRKLDVDAVALRIKDANGNTIGDASFAESATNLRALGEKVPQVFAKDGSIDISHLSYPEIGEVLKTTNPVQFKRYLESIGLDENTPMDEVMKVAIERGDLFTQTKALEGWRQVLPTNVQDKVEEVIVGTMNVKDPGHYETVPGVFKDAVKTVYENNTKQVFDPTLLKDSAIDGLLAGTGITMADALHESIQPTRRVDEGTFEERNPYFFISKIASKQAKKLKEQRKEQENKEKNKSKNKDNKNNEER